MEKLNKCYCCDKEVEEFNKVKGRLLCKDCFELLDKSMEFLKNIKEA